jgi:hypothetical protein
VTDLKSFQKDLEALTEDELAELIQAAAQVEKHDTKTREYMPNAVQDRVHRSCAFIRALFSGNGVGKTTAAIQEGLWTAQGTHPYRPTGRIPNTVVIVVDDASKAETVYLTELRKKKWYDIERIQIDNEGRSYPQVFRFPNGSEWRFMTHEMADSKFESIQCSGVIFDEPPPRRIFVALLRGQREKGMKPWVMFCGTPLGRHAPWMYREIYRPWRFKQDDEIECFFGSTDDNLDNLDPDTIKRWEKRYTPQELRTRRHGEFEFLSGRIFTEFAREHHVEKDFAWPQGWSCILAMDPHLRKNHVAVVLGIDPDKEVHCILELETSLAGRRAAEFFLSATKHLPIKWGVCDNFGSMAGTGGEERKSFIDIFNETAQKMNSRVRIRPTTKAEKRDDEWIEDMKDWLRLELNTAGQAKPLFHVFESCVKTIDNFESYVWDEHRGVKSDAQEPKEEPLGTNQDQLMCVKYGMALKPDKIGVDKIYRKSRHNPNAPREYESASAWRKD